MIRLGVLTISDRAAHGQAEDRSGPLIADTMVRELGAQVVVQAVVADERYSIESLLVQWADGGQVDLVLTTGGTGFAPRDVTPEATASVTDRPAPGFAEAMRAASLPHAMLSRATAGIRSRTLIINLPGSPKAVAENLAVIMPALSHAAELLQQEATPAAYQHALPGEH